jgi:hypothetical protein
MERVFVTAWKLRALAFPIAAVLAIASPTDGQETKWAPGVERWQVKTHLKQGNVSSRLRTIKLSDLKKLDWRNLSKIEDWKTSEDCLREPGASSPQECDIVSTEGYVQLVAVEATKKKGGDARTDGDYHVQVSSSREDRDDVVIVEIPRPEFVDDPELRSAVLALREMFREKLHGGKEFSMSGGSCMQHPPRMRITGQLFLDSPHASLKEGADPGGGRGKSGHKAATIWEIHPVYEMEFLDPKDPTKPAVKCP